MSEKTDAQPIYCLHKPHPDLAIEAKAREIYLSRYGAIGGKWELNETPESWWDLAQQPNAMRIEWCSECGGDGYFEEAGSGDRWECRACDAKGETEVACEPLTLEDIENDR